MTRSLIVRIACALTLPTLLAACGTFYAPTSDERARVRFVSLTGEAMYWVKPQTLSCPDGTFSGPDGFLLRPTQGAGIVKPIPRPPGEPGRPPMETEIDANRDTVLRATAVYLNGIGPYQTGQCTAMLQARLESGKNYEFTYRREARACAVGLNELRTGANGTVERMPVTLITQSRSCP